MYEVFEQLLQKYGISAYKVSKETGISQTTLSDWKRGRSTPKQDKLQKIADYFNVSIDFLLGRDIIVKGAKEKYLLNLILQCECSLEIFSNVCGISEKELHIILTEGISSTKVDIIKKICGSLGITLEELDQIKDGDSLAKISAYDELKRIIRKRGKELSVEQKMELIKILTVL